MNIAVYAGSFDPFTNGHLSIVKNASKLFDKVYVVIARNPDKHRSSDVDLMCQAMLDCFNREGLTNCIPLVHAGLIAELCYLQNAQYLIRGLRNTSDYMYEENIAKINQEINPGLKTIYFRAENDVISSSMIRELKKYGKDVTKYIPKEIALML